MQLCPLGGDPVPILYWSFEISVENINVANYLQKNRKQFDSRWKGSPPLGTGSCLDYSSILLIYWSKYERFWENNNEISEKENEQLRINKYLYNT